MSLSTAPYLALDDDPPGGAHDNDELSLDRLAVSPVASQGAMSSTHRTTNPVNANAGRRPSGIEVQPEFELGLHAKLILGPRRPLSPIMGDLACYTSPSGAERVR
jgi:hypothetical protein